jgi:uncharacterized protein (DUF58 family)
MKPVQDERWQTAGGRETRTPFSWNSVLWALIFPRRRQRIKFTLPGLLLIALSFGVGTAAYNAANNILFIALSLLLASIVLSGVLSAWNFRAVSWRLQLSPPMRVGKPATVTIGVRNTKRIVPTYGLWFELIARSVDRGPAAKAESTLTARGIDVRAALQKAEQADARERLYLRSRLDPNAEVNLEWVFRPSQRGKIQVRLDEIGSLFPFGFLSKSIAAHLAMEAIVWPAPVEYRRFSVPTRRRAIGGERLTRAGHGSDLFALRRYERGDSHGLIHWKASARTGQLLVRQLAAESLEQFALWIRTDAETWSRKEQFELMLSFAATLAEDFFRADKLTSVAIDAHAPGQIRRLRDLETFLDELAILEPANAIARTGESVMAQRSNVIGFAPEGPHGVAAWVQGERIAAT